MRTRDSCLRLGETLSAAGVAVVIHGGVGNSQLVYSSDALIAALGELQFSLGEGPGQDAFQRRMAVYAADLNSADAFSRWPGFAYEAAELGAGAMFAFPLQIGTAAFGTAEVYRIEAGHLTTGVLDEAQPILDELVRAVLDDFGSGHPDLIGPAGLHGHPEVAQATGMIAVQAGISITQALAHLRASSFAEHMPIQDIAREVIARRRRFTAD